VGGCTVQVSKSGVLRPTPSHHPPSIAYPQPCDEFMYLSCARPTAAHYLQPGLGVARTNLEARSHCVLGACIHTVMPQPSFECISCNECMHLFARPQPPHTTSSVGSASLAPTLKLDPMACLVPVSLDTSRGLAAIESKREYLNRVLNSESII